MLCEKCGDLIGVAELKEGSIGAMESIRFLDFLCRPCNTVIRSHHICDVLIVKLAKLTNRNLPNSEQPENLLMVKVDELKDMISLLRSAVADTSFALGILYKELADVHETVGRMDKCVEAYKMMIPIVE